jgi:hypothetical protein
VLGLRGVLFGFDVDDHLEDLSPQPTSTSGTRRALLVSPKASLVFGAIPSTELYLNVGGGFHSNDARGVVRQSDPVTPLTRARGYELGARDATLGYRASSFEVTLGLQNVLNTAWREAQFANVSRLPDEQGPESCAAGTRPVGEDTFEGCEDLHFTPGAPFNAQATFSFFF